MRHRQKDFRKHWNAESPRRRRNDSFNKFKDLQHRQELEYDHRGRNKDYTNIRDNTRESDLLRNPFAAENHNYVANNREVCRKSVKDLRRERRLKQAQKKHDSRYKDHRQSNGTNFHRSNIPPSRNEFRTQHFDNLAFTRSVPPFENSTPDLVRHRTSSQNACTDTWNSSSYTPRSNNYIHSNNNERNESWQSDVVHFKSEPITDNCSNTEQVDNTPSANPPSLMSLTFNEVENTPTKKRRRKSGGYKDVEEAHEESEVICTGSMTEVLNLEDDEHNNSQCPELSMRVTTYTNSTQTETPAKPKRKRRDKNSCLLCDKNGHNEMQCQMICMNCNEPYHNMRTCTQPNQTQKTLTNFLDYCVKQFINK